MAVDPTPWLVGGGAEHSPEVARTLAYVASGGAEGVVTPTGLRVASQAVPNDSVRVLTGAAVILNRYPGGSEQSYGFRNPMQTTVSVDATGSGGGRTDLIVARVVDPQYQGSAPADPNDFQYSRLEIIKGVPSGIRSARDLASLNYPAIALAKVTLPASTATVTSGMIEDLREVANPRRAEVLRAHASVVADTETLTATGTDGEWFPNAGGEQKIDIPEWATRMIIEATWMQVREPGGNAFGECWVEFGPYERPSTRKYATQRYDWNTADGPDVSRTSWDVADYRYIPADLRGTLQSFILKARLQGTTGNSSRPQLNAKSGVKLRVTFLEVADPSTS